MKPRYYVRRTGNTYAWYWSGNPHTPEPAIDDPWTTWRGPTESPQVMEAIRKCAELNALAAREAAQKKGKKKK